MENNRFRVGDKYLDIIMNASGCHCKTKEQMDTLITNGMNTIITKTCTLEPNKGNPIPNYIDISNNISINCLGMPNYGYKYYRDIFPEYLKKNITYIISLDASNWNELSIMLLDYDKFISNCKNNTSNTTGNTGNTCNTGNTDNTNNFKYSKENTNTKTKELVEINISCPNILQTGTNSNCRIIAYDPLELSRLLENIRLLDLQYLDIGLKLSPYIDKLLLTQIANVINNYSTYLPSYSYNLIKYIVCSNSIPNGMVINTDTGNPILSNNTGGISGIVNKYISLSNTYQFNKLLLNVVIIGCGGIEKACDIIEYLHAGAKGIQIGRVLYIDGVSALNHIWHNLKAKL